MVEREETLIRSELLCYVQCGLNRIVKTKIVEGAGRAFSEEDILAAKNLLDKQFGDKLKNVKLKNRLNGSTKMSNNQMLDDIVSAMMELDQNNVKTIFGTRDILTLPKGGPRDLDSYAMLEILMVLEEKIRHMENGLNQAC